MDQVVRALDTCIVVSGRYEQQSPFALSTESLLEIGDHCNGEGYDAFNRLYELVILRNKRLRKCLNETDLIRVSFSLFSKLFICISISS